MKELVFDITPMGKPRMTRRDKWSKRPVVQAYWAFKDECKYHGLYIPESGSEITFVLPMPKSWTKKKKEGLRGKPHQQKPDVDNLLKAVLDAVYDDDSKVYEVKASKYWGNQGKIVVRY